jgi:hypothetical protein
MPASNGQFLSAHRSLYFYHGMKEEVGLIARASAFFAWALKFREISLHG